MKSKEMLSQMIDRAQDILRQRPVCPEDELFAALRKQFKADPSRALAKMERDRETHALLIGDTQYVLYLPCVGNLHGEPLLRLSDVVGTLKALEKPLYQLNRDLWAAADRALKRAQEE